MLQTAEGLAVNNPVAVPLVGGAHFALRLGTLTASGFLGKRRVRRQYFPLPLLSLLSNGHTAPHPFYPVVL